MPVRRSPPYNPKDELLLALALALVPRAPSRGVDRRAGRHARANARPARHARDHRRERGSPPARSCRSSRGSTARSRATRSRGSVAGDRPRGSGRSRGEGRARARGRALPRRAQVSRRAREAAPSTSRGRACVPPPTREEPTCRTPTSSGSTSTSAALDAVGSRRARTGANATQKPGGQLVALVSPHIDPWRGAVGYGHAYGAMKRGARGAGGRHVHLARHPARAGGGSSFCVVSKRVRHAARDDGAGPRRDRRARAGGVVRRLRRPVQPQAGALARVPGRLLEAPSSATGRRKIVPVLAGLGEHQARGTDPARDGAVETLLGALRSIVEARGGRAVLVAGADLAHVGPRFGDERPTAAELEALDLTDRASLSHAIAPDAPRVLGARRARSRHAPRVRARADLLAAAGAAGGGARRRAALRADDRQDDGSVVSHAAVGYS